MVKPLMVGITTRDGNGRMESLLHMYQVGALLNRPVGHILVEASQIVRGRNMVSDAFRQMIEAQPADVRLGRMFWLDSDIVLTPNDVEPLAKMIWYAENMGYDISARYHRSDGQPAWIGFKETIDDKECQAVESVGFGCLYAKFDPDYVFRADTLGEDVYYWKDHPHRPPYVWNHVVAHQKMVRR